MKKYDKKFFMYVVSRQNKEDYEKKLLNRYQYMKAEIEMDNTIDRMMSDNEKISWKEFYKRLELAV